MAAAAISTQKRCRAAEQDKRGGGQPGRRDGGWIETRMGEEPRRQAGGRETRSTQKSEQGKDKGITRGEETTWGRAFLTWPAPPLCSELLLPALCLHHARAPEQSIRPLGEPPKPPNPRGFSRTPKFHIATGEAAISASAKGLGEAGCISHHQPYSSFLFPKTHLG